MFMNSLRSKWVIKYLGFLISDFSFKYAFQVFPDYVGFCGPSETFSFYNDFGCFTLHYLVQRDEWGWFLASEFSSDQSELLCCEIRQKDYIIRPILSNKRMLKLLGESIRTQINESHSFFGISTN